MMDIDDNRDIAIDDLMESPLNAPDPASLTDNLTEPCPSDAVSMVTEPSSASAAGHSGPELDIPISNVSRTGRPVRQRQIPARYRDILPQLASPIDTIMNNTEPPTTSITRIRLIVRDTIRTAANVFGLWREYQHRPSYDPDSAVDADDLADVNARNSDLRTSPAEHDCDSEPVHQNSTIENLINWQNHQ